MTMVTTTVDSVRMLDRIRGEYAEMPGLKLTLPQAQRLWGLDRSACDEILRTLADSRYLRQTSDGAYVRCADRA
jgi:DNA-binding IclR family transcriptional regulator